MAEKRAPKLRRFMGQLLTFQDNPVLLRTLAYFLTLNEADNARIKQPNPPEEQIIRFDDKGRTVSRGRDSHSDLVPGFEEGPMEDERLEVAVALYDYVAREEDELSFAEGARILVHSRLDDEWMEGETGGEYGIFPINYVEVAEGEFEVVQGHAARDSIPSSGTDGLNSPDASLGPKLTGPVEELLVTERGFRDALRDVRRGRRPAGCADQPGVNCFRIDSVSRLTRRQPVTTR